ncbi:interleukin-12 receptor subunit beta-2 isoform X3 [Cyanistes caeruleus]|uniref:interleukin-12 receptor subunit beta-2 isoform X3 n=1 Tax=Cyanistes caeruleus TaxID=156563 RepID=UPI000CDA0359|nr:interleukin-12 receptor subunit beta-2 isoform X3 [Cyanistes caeruleus]
MFATPWASGVLVSWEEIPAPQQRGCITAYHIYLHRSSRQGQPEVHGAGDWLTLVLICSFLILSACVCSVPPARKVFQWLLSLLLPQWHSKAIPDPANATWARSLTATKAELSAPSSPFLPSGFQEPETTPVEESWAEPPEPGDKLLLGSAGSRGHWPQLYQRLLLEPEYISSPGPSARSPEPEPEPIPLFPFLPPGPCCQGNLSLDGVKLSGSSFPR